MNITHQIAGARASWPLVRDDEDRRALLEVAREELGRAILAYCIMDTHVHFVVETRAAAGLERVLATYARRFNRRHRETAGPLLRGPVRVHDCPERRELLRMIAYVHDNPLKTTPQMASRAVDFRWSSAREYAGLSVAGIANVERARLLLGRRACWVTPAAPERADLNPSRCPTSTPAEVLAAAAEVHGVSPRALAGGARAPRIARARGLYLRLGEIEGFSVSQLAVAIARSRAAAYRFLWSHPPPETVLRAARTLLRDAGLRARLFEAA